MRDLLADLLRGLTSAAVLLTAVVHLDVWASGFRDIATIGPLFLLDSISGIVLGVLVVAWRHWAPPLLAAGYGAVTVGAYWVSVVHGLFGIKEVTYGWSVILAEVAEYAAIVFGVAAAVCLRPSRRRTGPTPR